MGLILLFGGTPAPVEAPAPSIFTDFPTMRVEIDFGEGWVDLLAQTRSPLSFNRGRARETDRPATGICTVAFNNANGDFDRDNPGGAYYPNVRPNMPFRLHANIASGFEPFTIGHSFVGGPDVLAGGPTIVALFMGRTEGGPQTFPDGGVSDTVTWTVADGFKRLNLDKGLVGSASSELTGARINRILDKSSPVWPEELRDIDPGTRVLDAVSSDDPASNHLDYALLVAESEGGVFFISADGKATFRDANHEMITDSVPFGDIPGEQRYRDLRFEDDDKAIHNVITVTSTAQPDEIAEDLGSIAENGRIDMTIATLLEESADMGDIALDAMLRYSQMRRRIIAMELGTHVSDWRNILSKEIGDRVLVRRRTNYGTTIEQLSTIEGIGLEAISPAEWKLTWSLSLSEVASPNLLTANQSSLETDTTGWVAETNCTISASADHALIGDQSLLMDITTTPSDMSAVTTPTDGITVTVGSEYVAQAYFRVDSIGVGAFAHVEIDWLDAGEALLSTSVGTAGQLNAEWTSVRVIATAPASTAFAVVRLEVTGQIADFPQGLPYVDVITLREVL